jgi:hypothetical protein
MKILNCKSCKHRIYGDRCFLIKHRNKFKKGIIVHKDDIPPYKDKDIVKAPECYILEGHWHFIKLEEIK